MHEIASADQGGSSISRLMTQFQSLGDNCEFGIVQRYCGCEPTSLFRFTMSDVNEIVSALSYNLETYGAADDLEIYEGEPFYCCASRKHGFSYRTSKKIGEIDPEDLLKSEYQKVAHLKNKFRQSLDSGDKIFVRKGRPEESFDEFLSLAHAIRRYGPANVMRVEVAPIPEKIGMVHWHSPGIMVGYVSRFSPYQGGMDIDLEPWVTLCENALSLVTGVSQQTRSSDQQSFPIQAADKILRHTSRKTQTGLSSFGSRVAAPAFMPGEINVFSTWVWIPSNFDGSRLFGFIKIGDTYHRLGHRDADLAYRGAWQRVWLAAQIPSKLSHLQVGLAVIAGKGQTFWSTDWRASQYPIPIKSPPPSIGIRLGLRDWWSGQTAA